MVVYTESKLSKLGEIGGLDIGVKFDRPAGKGKGVVFTVSSNLLRLQ